MENVVLVVHLILALSIIGLVLIQKSEGGGLGIGGSGGGMGNLATAAGTGNLLTKTTTILAFCFFITSLTLAVMAGTGKEDTILNQLEAETQAVQDVTIDVPVVEPVIIPDVPVSE